MNRKFTEAVGRKWNDNVVMFCSECGIEIEVSKKESFLRKCKRCGYEIMKLNVNAKPQNYKWDNPVDIRHAIETIPCDKCGGKQVVISCTVDKCIWPERYCDGDIHACSHVNHYSCSCNNGVINRWDEFVADMQQNFFYIAQQCWRNGGKIEWINSVINLARADILTNPEYLKEAYLSFDEERKI